MRAVIYVRVSTQEQASEGVSLDNQIEKIKAYCYARSWSVVDLISDEGYSGKSLNRPGVLKIIGKAKQKEFDVVVTYKLDRLTRSVRDLGYLIEDIFNKHDIAFTSVLDNFDTSTANGKLILNVLGSVAQWERDIISERTKDALLYKKRNMKLYGQCPYGYHVDSEGNLLPVKEELDVINKMKDRRRRGLSLNKIADQLNTLETPTKNGGRWGAETVRRILNNLLHHAPTSG